MKKPQASASGSAPHVKQTIDRDRYVPFFLNTTANKMARGASRIYLKEFGIGTIEWAMLSFLSIEPGRTAQEICDEMSLDKAAASRSLKLLVAANYVAVTPDLADSRKRALSLTATGVALHDRVILAALQRERQLLAGFSEAERDDLIGYLKRMLNNLSALDP